MGCHGTCLKKKKCIYFLYGVFVRLLNKGEGGVQKHQKPKEKENFLGEIHVKRLWPRS
jgi:hypothetical protein